jgi:hypothetical protein
LGDFPRYLGDLGRGLGQGIIILFIPGDVEKKPRFLEGRALFLPGVDNAFKRRLFLENGLGFFAVVPEIGLGGDLVQFFDAFLLSGNVKAASVKAPRALRGGLIVRGFLLTSL